MRNNSTNHPRHRRGLAPLELVLWLPILLMVMALFVNLGTMQVWRMRGEIVARDVIWRTRWPRTGNMEPRPEKKVWPAAAAMEIRGEPQITQLDHEDLRHEVVRGPLPGRFEVRELLRPDQGAHRGAADITREFPLLPKFGNYQSGEIAHPLLGMTWQAAEMELPSNIYRRTKALYVLPKAPPQLSQNFVNSVRDLLSMPNFNDLKVLDEDEEVKRYYGSYIDFHPRVGQPGCRHEFNFDEGWRYYCELDPEVVQKEIIENEFNPLIDIKLDNGEIKLGKISLLPRRMTDFFLNMYGAAQTNLEQQIESMEQELDSIPDQISDLESQEGDHSGEIGDLEQRQQELPGQISSAQEELNSLDPKIQQLKDFKKRLPEMEQELEEQAKIRLAAG